MSENNNDPICIAGAGLVGSLWGVMMAQKGYNVEFFEKRGDIRKMEASAGRSINLALSDRGWKALNEAGVSEAVKDIAIPMYGRMIHDEEGNTQLLPYSHKGEAIYSISRSGLNCILMDQADAYERINFNFETGIEGFDPQSKELYTTNEEGSEGTLKFSRLFGMDGAFSNVRDHLLKQGLYNYSQEFIEYGYKELHIPPDSQGNNQIHGNALHIWPRKNFMLIALPNQDNSFTATLFLPFEGDKNSFEALQDTQSIDNFFRREFHDAYQLMPTLHQDFAENPTSGLVTIRCYPWHYDGSVCLMGDASHAIVPFFGQGMNAGFEDCTIMKNLIEKGGSWEEVFEKFSRQRKPDADAIADMALENFVEMRDKVIDDWFRLKQDLEKKIAKIFPDKWKTRYEMVTFSHLPYSEAMVRSRKQDQILEKLMHDVNVQHLMDDSASLEEAVKDYLEG